MNTHIILATLAFGLSAFGQSSPPPPTITLEIPIEAAGHSFQFIENYSGGGLLFAGTPVYDALTQKFLITGTPPYDWTAPVLFNDTLGNSPIDYSSNGFYITESLTWQSPALFGAGTIGYAVADSLANHSFALVAPGIGAFPVTKLPVLGSTVNDSDGNPVFVSMGFFNAFANTEIGSLSPANTVLVDLTAQLQSVGTATDLRDVTNPLQWATRTVAMPTRGVSFSFGPVDNWYQLPSWVGAYTLHTSSGSMQSLTPYIASIYDENTNFIGNEVRVSGQAGILEEYWLTRDGITESTPHFFMGLGTTEVLQSGAPFTPPVSSIGMATFLIGEDHYNEYLAVSQGGQYIPLDLDWTTAGQAMLVTWDQSGNEVQYHFNTYTATFDQNAPWELVDYNYYTNTLGTKYGRTTDLRGGFTPWNPVPPAGMVGLSIAAGRAGSLDAGQLRMRNQDGTVWIISATSDTSLYYYTLDNGSGGTFNVPYRLATVQSSAVDPTVTENVEVTDLVTGDTASFDLSTMTSELVTWAPLSNVTLTLPAARWNHTINVRTALGGDVEIQKGAIQGLWSNGWFTSYGTFTATATVHAGVDWWVWDNTTSSDYGAPNTLNLSGWSDISDTVDTDGDGLPDWYEYIIGTATDNTDTDGDGLTDYAEAAAGTNPNSSAPILIVTAPVGAVWVN